MINKVIGIYDFNNYTDNACCIGHIIGLCNDISSGIINPNYITDNETMTNLVYSIIKRCSPR